jgi:small subunit ribosomal protein S6
MGNARMRKALYMPALVAMQYNPVIIGFAHRLMLRGKNGKVIKVDNWGKRSLAYKIKRFRDAYYVVLTIEGDGAAIAELERRFRVTDYVIRFLSVRIDEDLKRSEKIKAVRQRKSRPRTAPVPQPVVETEAAQPQQ